jgi:hypothetical protein
MFKKSWKYSRLRFYILNTFWNYKFWIFAKKLYKEDQHIVEVNEYDMDYTFKLVPKKKKINRKRFVGYMYKNNIYIDNPGIQGIDQDTWNVWRRKKLL